MNMSVPEACDVDSREKWDVTLSNKYFFEPFFCDFLQKNRKLLLCIILASPLLSYL